MRRRAALVLRAADRRAVALVGAGEEGYQVERETEAEAEAEAEEWTLPARAGAAWSFAGATAVVGGGGGAEVEVEEEEGGEGAGGEEEDLIAVAVVEAERQGQGQGRKKKQQKQQKKKRTATAAAGKGARQRPAKRSRRGRRGDAASDSETEEDGDEEDAEDDNNNNEDQEEEEEEDDVDADAERRLVGWRLRPGSATTAAGGRKKRARVLRVGGGRSGTAPLFDLPLSEGPVHSLQWCEDRSAAARANRSSRPRGLCVFFTSGAIGWLGQGADGQWSVVYSATASAPRSTKPAGASKRTASASSRATQPWELLHAVVQREHIVRTWGLRPQRSRPRSAGATTTPLDTVVVDVLRPLVRTADTGAWTWRLRCSAPCPTKLPSDALGVSHAQAFLLGLPTRTNATITMLSWPVTPDTVPTDAGLLWERVSLSFGPETEDGAEEEAEAKPDDGTAAVVAASALLSTRAATATAQSGPSYALDLAEDTDRMHMLPETYCSSTAPEAAETPRAVVFPHSQHAGIALMAQCRDGLCTLAALDLVYGVVLKTVRVECLDSSSNSSRRIPAQDLLPNAGIVHSASTDQLSCFGRCTWSVDFPLPHLASSQDATASQTLAPAASLATALARSLPSTAAATALSVNSTVAVPAATGGRSKRTRKPAADGERSGLTQWITRLAEYLRSGTDTTLGSASTAASIDNLLHECVVLVTQSVSAHESAGGDERLPHSDAALAAWRCIHLLALSGLLTMRRRQAIVTAADTSLLRLCLARINGTKLGARAAAPSAKEPEPEQEQEQDNEAGSGSRSKANDKATNSVERTHATGRELQHAACGVQAIFCMVCGCQDLSEGELVAMLRGLMRMAQAASVIRIALGATVPRALLSRGRQFGDDWARTKAMGLVLQVAAAGAQFTTANLCAAMEILRAPEALVLCELMSSVLRRSFATSSQQLRKKREFLYVPETGALSIPGLSTIKLDERPGAISGVSNTSGDGGRRKAPAKSKANGATSSGDPSRRPCLKIPLPCVSTTALCTWLAAAIDGTFLTVLAAAVQPSVRAHLSSFLRRTRKLISTLERDLSCAEEAHASVQHLRRLSSEHSALPKGRRTLAAASRSAAAAAAAAVAGADYCVEHIALPK